MKKTKEKVKKLDDHLKEYRWETKKPLYIEKDDKRYKKYVKQLEVNGFCDTETWNLDCVISGFILPRLKRFKETTNGYPGGIDEVSTPEKWNEVLDKMIFAFEWNIMNDEESCYGLSDEVKAANWKRYTEGINLFAKYFRALWW